MSDATGEEHSFDATSDLPTAVGPAITITNGLYCCCLFSAVCTVLAVDMRAGLNESGFSRFLEFMKSEDDDRELTNAIDVLDGKSSTDLSI